MDTELKCEGFAMKCSICNKEIVLVPSAAERAKKYGTHPASYYTSLFTTHTDCFLRREGRDMVDGKRHKP